MATTSSIESPIARIKEKFLGRIGDYAPDVTNQDALLRAVLEQDIPQQLNSEFGAKTVTLGFREMDQGSFPEQDNATFDDGLSVTEAGRPATVETSLFNFSGVQLALAYLGFDSVLESGDSLTFDIMPDANAADGAAGRWLGSQELVTLAWNTEIMLDIYPTDAVKLKFSLSGAAKIRSVRIRFLIVGLSDTLVLHENMIAGLMAARLYADLMIKGSRMGWSDETLRNLRALKTEARNDALGIVNSQSKEITGEIGGPVQMANSYSNPYWERANA
jgi:hypothetical protein